MSVESSEQRLKIVSRFLLFIVFAALVVQLYPPVNKNFQYSYEIGRPWRYDLLTAEFDFPVYKPDDVVARERAEALAGLLPYLRMSDEACLNALEVLNSDSTVNMKNSRRLSEALLEVYAHGILPVQLRQQFEERKVEDVFVLHDEHTGIKTSLESIYTEKSAYARLAAVYPANNNLITRLIVPNLAYDSVANMRAQEQAVAQLSLTSGVIQTGEQIINRGDIVTAERFQVLRSLQRSYEAKSLDNNHSLAVVSGEVLFVGCFLLLFFFYLYLFRPKIFWRWRSLLCILLLMLLWIGVSAILIRTSVVSVYVVPFAFIPIVVRLFFDSRTGLFTHWIIVILVAFMAPEPMEFLFLQVAAGMTAVSSLKDITQRSQLAKTAGMIFLAYAAVYCAIALVTEGVMTIYDAWQIAYLAISSLMVLTAYGFIYILEKMFGFTSSITLVELTNVNSDLMLRFAEKAPGTFQHSLQVSNLATEAAKKINANSLLVRTGALYHDIGKMLHPEYFTENQGDGHNPLSSMQLTEAAQTVISHVTEGVSLARKEGLPQIIINFIEMHHGTSLTRYFYNTCVNQHPGETIDPRPFTYPGPMPDSKETGILMMADSVEAASRSLTEYTEESISALVDKIVNGQIASGQLSNTPLSFRDIEEIKSVFKEKLASMYHHRIQYPEIKR